MVSDIFMSYLRFISTRWRATVFINKFIIFFFSKKRLIVSLLHVFLCILSPRIWPTDHREVNERMKEVLRMKWRGMEWLECVTTNCKMWMSMMVSDEVDMEHEL